MEKPSTSYCSLSLAQPIALFFSHVLSLWLSTLLKLSPSARRRATAARAAEVGKDAVDLDAVLGALGMGAGGEGAAVVGFEELAKVFEEEEASMEEAMEAFRVFDRNRDGFIDAAELRSVLSSLGFAGAAVAADECRRMIAAYDENGDGRIDFEEFVKFMETTASSS